MAEIAGHDSATTAGELRTALERDELEVHYQPILALKSGTISGAEALVRWRHPTRGLLSPGAFLPAARSAGLTVTLGERVLRTVCAQAAAWRDAESPVPCVSFNPAHEQFRPEYLRDLVRAALGAAGLEPERLALELHEEVMGDAGAAAVTLAELGPIGVRLWVDDFGMGPSCVRSLKGSRFGMLKIGGEFVADIGSDADAARLVGALVGLARALGMEAVAEGVYAPEQLAVLRGCGCDHIQGWLFCRPLPPEALGTFLREGRYGDVDPLHLLQL